MSNSLWFTRSLFGGLALACATVLGTAGCGGSGGSGTGTSHNPDSPYAGQYSGNFVDQSLVIGGFSMTIYADGHITGQFNYPTPIQFTGGINNSGAGSITDSNGTLPLTLSSSGEPVLGGGIGTSTDGFYFTSITNPSGTYSGFAGEYFGTVQNKTTANTGIISLDIVKGVTSPYDVGGIDLFIVSGTPTLEKVAGSINSAGVLTYTVAGVTVTGTVSTSSNTITGNVSESNGDSGVITLSPIG